LGWCRGSRAARGGRLRASGRPCRRRAEIRGSPEIAHHSVRQATANLAYAEPADQTWLLPPDRSPRDLPVALAIASVGVDPLFADLLADLSFVGDGLLAQAHALFGHDALLDDRFLLVEQHLVLLL